MIQSSIHTVRRRQQWFVVVFLFNLLFQGYDTAAAELALKLSSNLILAKK